MDTLYNYMVSSPLPCVYFVISDKEQMNIYTLLSSFNKTRGMGRSERFYLKVMEKDRINEPAPGYVNWFEKVLEEPTCVVYCSDWQNYKVESSKILGSEYISDPNLVDILGSSAGTPSNLAKDDKKKDRKDKSSKEGLESPEQGLIRITTKNLEKLIRDDVDKFLVANREINQRKNVPHKFLFLITLNKNIKNPNKVVGALKNLDPSEVCAVCVSCGLTDINSKMEKLEQMIYETSISYYEKKIKKITKTLVGLKPQAGGTQTEEMELYHLLLNFKIGYLSEFLLNRKEAYAKYALCWNALKQMNVTARLIDKTSLSFFVCLRMLDCLFASDISLCLAIYLEYKEYLAKLVRSRYTGLYYNLLYLLNYFVAYKLEQHGLGDEKNSNVMVQQAAHYYKWAITYLIQLRKHILHLNNPVVPDSEKDLSMIRQIEQVEANEELLKTKGVNRKYYLPCDLNNIFYYEDADYGSLYVDKDYITDVITENEFEFRGDKLELFQVLEEGGLENETRKIILKTFNMYKNLNHPSNLVYMYSLLGDSFYLSNDYSEALKIYLITLQHILYNINFNQKYANIMRKYSYGSEGRSEAPARDKSKKIRYVHIINMLMYSELVHGTLYLAIFIKLLAKVILALAILLGLKQIPKIVYELSDLPSSDTGSLGSMGGSRDFGVDDDDLMDTSGEEEMRRLILVKSIITFISLYPESNTMTTFLDYVITSFEDESPRSTGGAGSRGTRGLSNDPIVRSDSLDYSCSGGSNPPEKMGLESYLLLSKDTKSQYIYKYDNDLLEIILNFQLDVNLDLRFYEGYMDTSEGLLSFYYQTSQYIANTFIIYSNQSRGPQAGDSPRGSGGGGMVSLPLNKRIILIVQFSFYNIKSFKINGIILKTYYGEELLINSVVLTNQYVMNNYFKKLYNVINLGCYTSHFHLTNHFSNNRDDRDNEALVNLIYLSFNNYINMRCLGTDNCKSLDVLELMKIMNLNLKMKIFIKNVVRNVMAPITIIFLYNQKFHHFYNQFRYELQVDHSDFYVLGRDDREYKLYRTSVVQFDFTESVVQGFALRGMESIKLNQGAGQPYCMLYDHADLTEAIGESEMDEEVLKYLNIYKNNHSIYVMYGLVNMASSINISNSIKFNLHIKDIGSADADSTESPVRDVERMLRKEKEENILLYSKVLDIHVNNHINLNVNYKYYNDLDMLLYINLINNTPITYRILKVNILYNNRLLTSENKRLYGYTPLMNAYENLNFIYSVQDYRSAANGAGEEGDVIQIQITKYIEQQLYYPFNFMKHFLKYTINKFINVNDEEDDRIRLVLRHKYIVTLGVPFNLEAEITNTTDETMEYEITLADDGREEERPFILEGPINPTLVALPRSSETLSWTLVPTRCKIFNAPTVSVSNKLDSTKNTRARSRVSRICVVP